MRKKTQQGLSALLNNVTYLQYYNRLVEIALSRYEWTGLPEPDAGQPGIDERFLELTLFQNGSAALFKDDVMGFLGLPVSLNGALDVYNNPVSFRAYANNGYNLELNNKTGVLVYNNYLKQSNTTEIEMFAKRLYLLDRIIDVNVNAQKTPCFITCDENERLTYQNLFMQFDGNQPIIFGKKGITKNDIQVLRTDAPYVADKIYQLKTQIWNEALTYLGIPNSNTQKKERLISDEVNRQMGGVLASRSSGLAMRQKACEQFNRMYGTDIWVEYRQDADTGFSSEEVDADE